MRSLTPMRGMSLIDVLVGSALVVVIFLGLFGIMRASIQVAGLSRAHAAANAIASSQMEYVRSLSYTSVGTFGGIPAGPLAQTATTTQAGIVFTVRTFIQYVDDPKDGSGLSDSNGIVTDYKVAKVTVSYTVSAVTHQVVLVSNIAPPSIETTTGGGTLQARVVDALGIAVSGATVRIQNASTSPTIDVSTFSDTGGTVYLPGAPTSTQYRVSVSKTGYSSAQTYARDTNNQNPLPGYLTVVANQTTTSTFAIDLLATFVLRTFTPIAAVTFSDTFTDATKLTSMSGTAVAGGSLVLSGAPGSYTASGTARSTTTAPAYLVSWASASSTIVTPAGTSARIFVTDGSGTLLPDAVLPGNSIGFTGTIDLSSVSTTTYPALALSASLTTSDVNSTPSIGDWRLGYSAGPTPIPNIAVTLTGAKTIGSTGGGASIYKTTIATTTDATGVRTLSLEWDSYQFAVTGHTIISTDPETPFEVQPGVTIDASIIITP